jgi:NADPH:quinone reductase-like Zn-dependent oxidoreductase
MKTLAHNVLTHTVSLIEVDPPQPSATEHLIRVHAVALTNGELTWSKYGFWDHQPFGVPGFDVSGTIITTVRDSLFKVGDEVYGRVAASRLGCAREIATILPSEMALRPASLSIEEATTVPMSAETAWQALFVHAGLNEPEDDSNSDRAVLADGSPRILILNASGRCGLFAVQFAKLVGAYVVATCGSSNLDFVKDLGADEVIDYKRTSLSVWRENHAGTDFDVILDCAGAAAREDAATALKPGGTLISIVPDFEGTPISLPEWSKAHFFIMKSDGEQLARISRLIEQGKCSTVVNSVWTMEQFEQAFERVGSGFGKVVLKIGEFEAMKSEQPLELTLLGRV